MNKTKIDWCDSTWNPVTGCLHGCEYCYARKIAERFGTLFEGFQPEDEGLSFLPDDPERFCELNDPVRDKNGKKEPYPTNFYPTLHRYRLDEYLNKKGRNIFVCSMADLFGEWVPDSWIYEVFEACDKAPQHNYLFLTKNPGRYEKLLNCYMPPNMWFGWTQTGPMGTDFSFTTHHSVRSFISIEPLLRPFEKYRIRGIDWVIIGAETGHRKDKVIPKRKWVEGIVEQCRIESIPVFMKSSLEEIWGESLIQEFPQQLIKSK